MEQSGDTNTKRTDHQEKAFQKLKENIHNDPKISKTQKDWCNDGCVLRYLRAREWNLEKAEEMLRKTLAWRLEVKPDQITYEAVAKVLDIKTIYHWGFDKEQRPVVYCRIGATNPFSADERLQALIYTIEDLTSKLEDGVETMTWILDFVEYSWSNSRADTKKVSRQSMELLQDHYPERLGLSLMVNPPWYLSMLFKIFSPFMNATTKSKLKVLGSGMHLHDQLLEYIDDAQLDVRYGGKNEPNFKVPEIAPTRETEKPTAAQQLAFHNQMTVD